MAVSKFPPSTGRPIDPADGVLQLLPISQAQSSVSNLEMISIIQTKNRPFSKPLHFKTATFTFKGA